VVYNWQWFIVGDKTLGYMLILWATFNYTFSMSHRKKSSEGDGKWKGRLKRFFSQYNSSRKINNKIDANTATNGFLDCCKRAQDNNLRSV